MTQTDKLVADFIRSEASFPYREFEKMIRGLGYVKFKGGKTGGSNRKFYNAAVDHYLRFHEPHDGEMTRGMIKRLKQNFRDAGVL